MAKTATSRGGGGGGEHLRLSMSFDGGFHRIPWTDVYDPPRRGGGGRKGVGIADSDDRVVLSGKLEDA